MSRSSSEYFQSVNFFFNKHLLFSSPTMQYPSQTGILKLKTGNRQSVFLKERDTVTKK